MYFNKISTEGASKLHNAKEFHKENRKHETLVPINSQEKVLTDLHRMPKQKSLEVYNSSTLFSFPVENVLIRNTASLANSRNNGNPRIRSHSSSEAEQLPSKQSKQSSKTQVSLKQNLVPLVKPIRGSEADPSYCGSPRSLESVRSPLVRSLSDICLEASPDLLRKDVLRASASTSCVSNKCSSLHKRLNAFELCEQHSFTQSRDLLCNVDFLCRLNFVANRMTEDVAEAAGSELRAFYRSQTNPRARYFTEYPLHGRSMSEDSESDARSGVNFTVKPAEVQPLTTNFLKLFGGKRSTASTLSWFQQDPRINGSRKVSEQPASRKVSDGSEILNLLRRSSGADSRALTESPLRLPDNALIGLSNEEREHVMTVLQKSTRSQSPSVSRRPSSALQVLPELENISDAEREHIQSVLERANSPFTLRAQKLSRTASPDIPRRIQEEAMANDAMRQVELHKQRQKASEREEATMTLTPETAIVIESARETKNLLGEAAKTFEEQPPPQMIGSVPSSLSTPPATALKSFFGKAKDSVKNVTTVIAKEAKVVVGSPGNDLDHLARIQRLADHFLPGEHLKEAVSRKQTQGSEGGLTQEELEHIRNVAAMADKELGLPSSRSEEKKPLRKQQSVTKEKLEHIERTTAMAAQEEISSCERRTSAVQEPMKKAKDATTVASFANRFNPFDRKVEEELKKNQKREKDLVEPVGLTDEEMEHIKKIASMADRETASFENFRKSESQRRITPDNVPDTVSSKASHTLTEEETEHIRRVAAMAAEDAQPPQNVKVGNELSAKEIEHIQRIAATAENDASRTQLWTPKVSISKQAADELTEEEMEHIRRITELAEMETGEPFPKATRRDFDSTSASSNRTSVTQTKEKKEELTAEEMEHIARIAALAEQDVLEKLAKEEPDITAYVSPLVTDEELEHTRKITEMTEKDLKQPQQRLSVFEEKLVSQTPELTEEELEHIRRVTEMAEEDYARHTSPEQPKYETVWKGDAGFSHPSADDGKFYEFGRVIQTTHKPSEVELTAEEFEHIRRIEEMANFDQEKTSFSGQPYSEHPSLEEIYRVVTPSVMTDSGSSDNSMPDAGKLQEEEEIQQPSTTNEYPTDLTEEELEHIRRVTAMAEQIGPDEFFVTPKYTNSVRMESGQSELTEEELEHIRRVTAMADQINSYDAQMVEPQKTFDRREHEELAPATGNLTAEELEHIRRITSMAEDFRGPFDSYSQLPQVIMKTPVKSKDGLTAEELEHIRKIEAMANMDSQEEFSGANAQTVGQQVPHDNFIPIPNTPDLETAVSLAPKYGELEESLTVEEMEHIRRVEAMASGTYEAYEENEFQGDQYGSEDFDRRSLEEADKPWAENADILQYDDEQDQLEDIGHEKVEEVERASEEESEPDTSEELDSRILDRWSPKEDGEWKGETANERGESFEIKEVQEMPRDETLEKWYDEQLSHLRESMADEDDEEEVDSWSPQEETFTEQSPPYSQPDRRPSDALHIATLAPASLTPFVTPLTEQPSGPISSPAQSLFSGWPSRIDRPSSPMSTAAQAGRFRLSGLGKFAAGAFEKAKKAGEQLQAAADPSRPPPAAAESEEERLRREAVEACARLDAVAPPSPMAPPLGMEGLSAEEQRQIMAVLAEAEADSAPSPRPPSTPQAPPPAMMPSTSRGSFAPSPQPPPSTSPIPSGLEELSEEEQRRIMAVIAQAEAMDAAEPPRPPSRRESAHMAPITPTAPAGQEIPPGLEELSQEERNRILAVIANAEMSIGQEPPQVVHQPEPLPAVFPTDKSLGGFPSTDSEPPSEAVSVSEPSDWVDPSSFEYRRPSAAIPRTTQLPLGPATETCVDADLSPREEQQPKERRRSSSGVRQPSLTSSSGSPVRESGYGTASTSFATELGDFAYKPSTLLDETMDQREGARSRNGSRADEVDDDFTYSDQRFSELNDDELFHVTQHDEESVTVDAVEAPLPWRGGRMWTTVFEGDEAHREPAHASPTDAVDMDEVYDNFLKGGTVLQEIAFDSTPRRVEEPSERKKSGEMKPPPEIMVTVHEDRRSDSEEEESGSEDDDEYPDRVVAAPVAAPPSFEDVERERLQQEQFGKEVLQQIQAFGESANDEFDVQWAKVALAASKDNKVTPTSVELSTQPSEQPLDVSSAQRKNPFLDSPEEEDVSVDMEELDLTTAARIYQGVLTTPSHRPVYTIPEDDSEDDGAKTNTDSRLHAREKRRIAARSVADHIIQLSSQGDQAQPTTCHSAVVSNPQQATTVETIICTVSPLLYTSSYLFSTAPFVLPTSSPPTFTSPSTTVSEAEKRAAALNSSIDKTLSDIHHLLDTCSVYSSEKSKPNLLCYTGTAFENKNVLLPSEEVTSCSPSPSFLLPLSATLGQGLEEEESPSHGLRRSPGMMLPAEKSEPLAPEMSSIFETAMEKTTQRKEEDDVPAAVQDMGRRKLPSIPSQPAYSTTATYPAPPPGAYIVPHIESEPQRLSRSAPAPVYLSSSAPSVSTSSIPTYTAFSASGTQTLPNGSAITDRPSTSMSWTSTASTSKARDPAILPGAAFHVKPRIAIRQPVSSVIGRKAGGSKIPNTLARVLLKKELKEALSRRKETLEACEIEANQRQYVVHRMLVTGLLPEGREDDTPKVIPCLLPVELINGARVIPKKTCSVATQKSEDDMFPPKYVEPPTPKPPPHARASVAVQMDEPLRPSTSLRAQLRPFMQKRVAETQTDFTSLPFCRETTLDRERLSRRDQHDATCQTTDLLEATRKYFEDYDRKLKELGSRTKRQHHRHHFEFHDDEDALTREERRNQLSEELHRRRERLWASTELPSYDGAGAGISDYSRDYQHYGSLPRFDRSQAPRDFTVREQPVYGGSQQPYSYASLPRNYERILAPAPLEPIQIEYEQSFGGRPYGGGGGQQTRSMLDLHGGYDHLSYPQEERSSRGRSMTYLDQMEDLPRRMEDPRRLYPRTFDLHGRHYAQDTTNCALPGEPDLLSQYATYLQREFQPTLMAAEPRQQHLRQPLSDPYRFSYQQPPEAYGTLPAGYGMQTAGYGTLPSAKPAIRPQRYEAPLSDPYSAPAEVYSRSENNYGARPAGFSLDYGNLQRRAPLYRNQEDALSRVYASRRRVADPSPPSQFRFRSLGNLASAMPSSAAVASPRPQTTKRLLLTRCYRDHNIYNDLGVRVVGGKRLRDGTLGAFVSAVNQSKFNQTLGEIRPGDQVLEWNGVLLSGKTFEEVERVVNASSGEVEVVVRCGEGEYGSTVHEEQTRGIMTRTTERNISPDRRPPVPMHRKQNARIYDCVDTLRNTRKSESGDLGHLQVAAFYDQRMSKLIVRVQSARGLKMRDLSTRSLPNPFVKIYLLPGRKVSHKRRTRFVPCSVNPEWNQQVDYDVPSTTLSAHCVELSIWDYDKFSENNALGRVLIPLSDASVLSGVPRWYPVEALDARLARSHLNAPLERHMTAANNYVPALLDIGYPAID